MPATPILFNARDVATSALQDLGVLADGEVLSASDGQLAFGHLNRLVMQLRLQEFTIPFVSRLVFPITASQNTYTIGPGGDFNTERPQQVDGCGLLLAPDTGTFAITAVSSTNRTFTVAGDVTGSFPSGSDFLVTGSTGNNGNYTIITAVFGTSTVVTVSEAVPSTVADGTITTLTDNNATTEIPVAMLTDDAYQAIRVKGMNNTQFTQCYYNPTYQGGLGLIWLWPKPVTAVNAIALYLDNYVQQFENPTTRYSFPPGYFDLFAYGLARRLKTPFGVPQSDVTAGIDVQFQMASNLVKRQNVKRNDMPTDVGALGTDGGYYNILTGNR